MATMRAIGILGLLFMLLVVPEGSVQKVGSSAEVHTDPETIRAVVTYLDEQRRQLGIPGMAVAIVQGDTPLVVEGLGEAAEGVAVSPATPFLINSMSKSITALALMQLVEAGRVDLGADVTDYIPELSPGADGVFVADLMHHTSGLSDSADDGGLDDEHDTLEATVLRLESLFGPDRSYEYTNGNYDTLALIVERVAGVPFDDYVASEVFGPLGMSSSVVGHHGADLPGAAQGHYKAFLAGYRPFAEDRPGEELGSAIMYSTVADMARYIAMHMNGGTLDGARVISAEGLSRLHMGTRMMAGSPIEYGGGLIVEPGGTHDMPEALARHTTVWHGGASDSFRSVMWMTLGPDVGMVLLTNGNDRADESWMPQLSYSSRLILAGEDPLAVGPGSEFLRRNGKAILFGIALTQLVLAIATVPVLVRRRRGQPVRASRWSIVGLATLVDLTSVVLLAWVAPSVAEAPLEELLRLPDLRWLVTAVAIGVAWGLARTVLLVVPSLREQRSAAV